MDRCEVCQRVLVERPDPKRRRCADHLAQLVLVPTNRLPRTTKTTKSDKPRGEGDR
jgi:hypothetical protein